MEEKVITLRFRSGNVPEQQLYEKLDRRKVQLGVSMPVCVKELLRQVLEDAKWSDRQKDICTERIREVIREELTKIATVQPEKKVEMEASDTAPETEGNTLPNYSDSFPEGLNSVLDRFQ